MRADVENRESEQPLFRRAAVRAVAQRLFGSVVIVVPPSGRAGLLVAALAVTGLPRRYKHAFLASPLFDRG